MSEEVLIVARTHMRSSNVCVGGLVVTDSSEAFLESLRLLGPEGQKIGARSRISVGQIWELTYSPATGLREPHTEDVQVSEWNHINQIDDSEIASFLRTHAEELRQKGRWWEGPPESLFDGSVEATGRGSGYIQDEVPAVSTGFWIPGEDLNQQEREDEKVRYRYDDRRYTNIRLITYKGTRDSIERVPEGTVCRVSLARWWDNDGRMPERCYLQLSDYYIGR